MEKLEKNIKIMWQEVLLKKVFCDVTLACDKGQLMTHKVVISSASSVFKKEDSKGESWSKEVEEDAGHWSCASVAEHVSLFSDEPQER